ncbi:MAG TPA: DUF1294 domain-containing protein [Helicobacteraceae bacterium]|nr:DUF1294 domain-containing protein [Helicobacteraceae bacterium]
MSRAFIRYGAVAIVGFIGLYYVTHMRMHFISLWAFLISMNLLSFLFYGLDKLMAKLNWLRIPEILLHLLAFFGGVIGALGAQQLFWHKTTKRSFQVIFWLIFIIQVTLLYVVLYTDLLKSLL